MKWAKCGLPLGDRTDFPLPGEAIKPQDWVDEINPKPCEGEVPFDRSFKSQECKISFIKEENQKPGKPLLDYLGSPCKSLGAAC
jgi:hypothetical protein